MLNHWILTACNIDTNANILVAFIFGLGAFLEYYANWSLFGAHIDNKCPIFSNIHASCHVFGPTEIGVLPILSIPFSVYLSCGFETWHCYRTRTIKELN